MDRTRIRWSNVGRLAGGLAAGGVLLAVVPGLVEAPEPPPLPADVGLTGGASGVYGYAPAADEIGEERPSVHHDQAHQRQRIDSPARQRRQGARQPRPGDRRPAPPSTPSQPTGDAPAPTGPAPPPVAVSAPAASPPPAPEPSPADEPEPEPAEQPPSSEPTPPPSPSQFGFEH